MAKKYNNNSHKFADWTTQKLKDEARGYHQTIYEIGCYGTKDLMNYDGVVAELENRGYEIGESLTIHKN
jgi:hypothetical protein